MVDFVKTQFAVWKLCCWLGGAGGVALAAAPPAPPMPPSVALPATNEPAGPRIRFAAPVFDFGRLGAGEVVKHDFWFTNVGAAVLEISSVHPSCGCTTAGEWSRKVEPGKTGSIPVQFNSGNFSGPILKTVTVACNDPTQPSVVLQIKGTVWRPIEITPAYAVLNVTSESVSNATCVVRILNHRDEPLQLGPPESNHPAFRAELQTNQPGKEFTLVVRAVPPLPASGTQGLIQMKTSVSNPPTLGITALVVVQAAVVVAPDRLLLPAGPLRERWTGAVTIRNQLAAPLQLSEPTLQPAGGEFELKEVNPGRLYQVTLAFPAGFQLPPNTQAAFSVKSSHAQQPLLRIPIVQLPPPASAPRPAAPARRVDPLPAPPMPPAAR